MNNEDEETINMAQECINDYNLINVYKKEIKKKLSPEDTIALHKHTLRYLQKVISTFESKKVVVVTHHAPSKNSLKCPEGASDLINGVYSSNLDEFIESHPNIKLWIHGHIHSYHNYTIGSTQVICNPRGYIGYENISKNFEWKVVEI
jgi:Icc-related predicted phosphoesterase